MRNSNKKYLEPMIRLFGASNYAHKKVRTEAEKNLEKFAEIG